MIAEERATRGDPLAPLKDDTLRSIAASGVIRSFPRHTILINEGDVGDALYVLLSGRVKVFSSNEAGREFVIDFHGPGEYVGEMTLDGEPRSASVVTVEPTTCAVVNRAQFRDFILAHPDFAMHLIERLIHRVRVTTDSGRQIDVAIAPATGDELPPGLLFIAYGDLSSRLMDGETHGSGMPTSKGFDVTMEKLG